MGLLPLAVLTIFVPAGWIAISIKSTDLVIAVIIDAGVAGYQELVHVIQQSQPVIPGLNHAPFDPQFHVGGGRVGLLFIDEGDLGTDIADSQAQVQAGK
ncbi:hypothetical protein ES703_98423 [subsurface metagenome]